MPLVESFTISVLHSFLPLFDASWGKGVQSGKFSKEDTSCCLKGSVCCPVVLAWVKKCPLVSALEQYSEIMIGIKSCSLVSVDLCFMHAFLKKWAYGNISASFTKRSHGVPRHSLRLALFLWTVPPLKNAHPKLPFVPWICSMSGACLKCSLMSLEMLLDVLSWHCLTTSVVCLEYVSRFAIRVC